MGRGGARSVNPNYGVLVRRIFTLCYLFVLLLMAYTDFTPAALVQQFGLDFQAADLFPACPPLAPSAWLTETLARAQRLGYVSEKSRSERLVSPVLTELHELNQQRFTVHSGVNLDVDAAAGLRGECDFVLALSPIRDFVVAPIFCITEAKKQDLELGTVQCAAQLVGAQRLNEQAHRPLPVLFGCATTGVDWRFLTLSGQQLVLDNAVYSIRDLPVLLGTLQHLVARAVAAFG